MLRKMGPVNWEKAEKRHGVKGKIPKERAIAFSHRAGKTRDEKNARKKQALNLGD